MMKETGKDMVSLANTYLFPSLYWFNLYIYTAAVKEFGRQQTCKLCELMYDRHWPNLSEAYGEMVRGKWIIICWFSDFRYCQQTEAAVKYSYSPSHQHGTLTIQTSQSEKSFKGIVHPKNTYMWNQSYGCKFQPLNKKKVISDFFSQNCEI